MTAAQILEIVQYIVCGSAVLFSIAQFIYNKVKGSKSKFLSKLLEFLQGLGTSVEFAEKMTKLKPEEKKSFAMEYITMFCENKKVKFTTEQLDKAVEFLVNLTKTVNAREKDLIDTSDELVGNTETGNAKLSNGETVIKDGETLE